MKIVLVGDSLSVGVFPHLVRELPGSDVINHAHGGWTITRLRTKVSAIAAERADLVLVMAGTNDIATGATADQAARSLREMLAELVASRARVLVSPLPPLAKPFATAKLEAAREAFNRQIPALAKAGGARYVPAGLAVSVADLSSDGVHFGPAGYAKIAKAWAQGVDRASASPTRAAIALAAVAALVLAFALVKGEG